LVKRQLNRKKKKNNLEKNKKKYLHKSLKTK